MSCGTKKIILGCGNIKKKGWIGIDKADYGQEIIRDIIKGLPFCDKSCDEILADQVLEHIEKNDDFIFLMNECLRVLKFGGKMNITVPYYDQKNMYDDPTHCRFFTDTTFQYLTASNSWNYGFNKMWEIIKNEIWQNSDTKKVYLKVILESKEV